MLIEFKVQNFASFNTSQTLSMLASSTTKENFNEQNTIPLGKFGIGHLLKTAAIFGANASGKSNFIESFQALRALVLESLTTAEADNLDVVIPFLIKEKVGDIPSEFEVSFFFDGNLYRYGISILDNAINEEWLYWTKTSRETMLFHRNGQKIEINNRSFSEAKDFIRKEDGYLYLEKTRDNVPFISVLYQFNGAKSHKVINWFKNVNIISGIKESAFKNFTIELFDSSKEFKHWALDILSALQIQNLRIVEVDNQIPETLKGEDEELNRAFAKIQSYIRKNVQKEKKIEVVKRVDGGQKEYILPLSFESEGTRKLIYLLGPIFYAIKNSKVLLIDEFDNRFHSLLSKYIIDLYQKQNKNGSQLIITCHDTNLLTKDLFRRDQVWFVEKSNNHESQLYSLVEYKEHYTRKENSYSKDYLSGKYGGIPLLKSIDDLEEIAND